MLRHFLTLTVAAALLAPLAASADTPAAPATPAAPTAPAAPKPNNRMGGTISAVDAVKKTLTLTHHKKEMTVSVADDAKIYKAGERGKNGATGTWADLTVGTRVNVHTNGDETAPVANEVHIQAPKAATPAAPATP